MHLYFWIILSAFILFFLWNVILDLLNIRNLKENISDIPPAFKEMDEPEFRRVNSYTKEKLCFDIFSSSYHSILLLIFVFLGVINFYNGIIFSLKLNYYLNGIAYFYFMILVSAVLEIPLDLYITFKIEKRYGFNTITPKLWLLDFFKGQLVSLIILSILTTIAFVLVRYLYNWWIWLWLALFLFSIFMLYVSPYVIEPLFNKFVQVDDEVLIKRLSELLDKAGIKLSSVQKVDASKRTRHTNAYFSGIGKVKRIVLYDTLLEKLNTQEILAVLAHEAGHWKKKHILKRIFLIEAVLLIVCNFAWQIINSDFVIRVFGINSAGMFHSIEVYLPCVVFLVYFIFSLVFYPFAPLMNYMSRIDEKEADDFACKLIGNSSDLSSALKKLAKDNLSNLKPHKLYSLFHYSHPPVAERLEYLQKMKF